MSHSMLWTGMYDLSDDKLRQLMRQLFEGYGLRTQYSVFECWLDRATRQALMMQLGELCEQHDRVAFAQVIKPHDIITLGSQPTVAPADYFYIG